MPGIIETIEFMLDPESAKRVADDSEKAGHEAGSRFKAALETPLGRIISGVFGAELLTRFVNNVGEKVREFALEMKDLAMEGERTKLKMNATFGAMTEEVEKFIRRWGDAAGYARGAAEQVALGIASMGPILGLSTKQVSDATERIMDLAGDMKVRLGVPVEDASFAIRRALMGATRQLQLLGIWIDQKDVEKLAKQMHEGAGEVTRADEAMATLALTEQALAGIHGSLYHQSETLTKQERDLRVAWENTKETMAEELLPVLHQFFTMLGNLQGGGTLLMQVWRGFVAVLEAVVSVVEIAVYSIAAFGDSFAILGYKAEAAALKLAGAFDNAVAAWKDLTGKPEEAAAWRAKAQSMKKAGEEADKLADKYEHAFYAYMKLIGKAVVEDPHASANTASKAEIDRILGRGGKGVPIKSPPGRGAAEDAKAAQDKADAEEQRRIAVLAKGAAMEATRAKAVEALKVEQAKLEAELKKGNLTLERRIMLEGELQDVQAALAKADPTVIRLGELDKLIRAHRDEYNTMQALLKLRKDQEEKIAKMVAEGASKSEIEKATDILGQINDEIAKMDGPAVFAAHTIEAIGKTNDAMAILKQGVLDASEAMGALGAGSAKAYLQELTKMAEGNYRVAMANVLKYTGLALYDAATGNFGGAAAMTKAALVAGAEAVKWRAVMAVGNLVGGGASAGGAGGGGGAGGAGSTDTGAKEAAKAEPKGPHITIYVDGVDPDNPRHQAYIYDTYQEAMKRVGPNGTGTINVRRRPASWRPVSGG